MKFLFNRGMKFLLLPILLLVAACSTVDRDVFSEDAHQGAVDAGIISRVEALDGGRVERNLVEVGFEDIFSVQDNVMIAFDTSIARNLYFERDDVRVTNVLVSLNQQVSEGDILAIAEFDTREVEAEIEVLLLAIERHERAYERDLRQHQRTLREMRTARDLMVDANSRRVQNLRIQRQELVLDNFTRQNERSLEDYNARLEELSELLEGEKIIAPFDGVVVMVRSGVVGSIIRNHDAVLRIIDPAELQFVVRSDTSLIRFGDIFNTVLLGYNYEFNTVVASDPIAADTRESVYDFILQPTDRAGFLDNMRRLGVDFSDFPTLRFEGSPIRHSLDNVLAVPVRAINELDGDVYVLLYDDGEVKMRFIDVGFRDDDNVQVLSGLVPGQMIVR